MARIDGTKDPDSINGTESADHIFGYGGDDTISGGRGEDVLHGGEGSDYLWGSEDFDRLLGGDGDDILVESEGGDALHGGAGIDTLRLSYISFFGGGHGPVRFDFNPTLGPIATPDGNTAYNVEQLEARGSTGADVFKGWMLNDTIGGWDGNDRIHGRGGDDFLYGENGDDVIHGGEGNDILSGGGHNDVLVGGKGNDMLIGGRGFDTFSGDDILEGGPGADTFVPGLGRTDLVFTHSDAGVYVDLVLRLGFGGDAEGDVYDAAYPFGFRGKVLGSDFNDMLVGGVEQYGGGGDDRLVAGNNTVLMEGGDGYDVFVFRYDSSFLFDIAHITDLDQGLHELIDVSGIDARGTQGDQAFHFIGTDPFSGKAGELRYEIQGSDTVIQMNADKDDNIDFTVVVAGVHTLTEADFIL